MKQNLGTCIEGFSGFGECDRLGTVKKDHTEFVFQAGNVVAEGLLGYK